MITVLSLTQFAFVALGIAALKILHLSSAPLLPQFQRLEPYSPFLLLVPVAWTSFAIACQMVNRGPLNLKVARSLGVIVAIASFLFLLAVAFLN